MTLALEPAGLEEALVLLAARPDATVVAGGTDVMTAVNLGRLRPTALLDLSRVPELRSWEHTPDRRFVGAGVTFARIAAELAEATALAQAARTVGSPQVRNRATLGGNLATASPAGDGIAALAAYDASIALARGDERRLVPWDTFLRGPKRTALAPGELVLGAEWRPPAGAGAFAKVGPRQAMVIAVASACVQLDEPAHAVRIALGSVGPTVLRAREAERLAGELDWEAATERELREVGRRAAAETRPIDDLRGSAEYRRHAVGVLVARTLGGLLAGRGAQAEAA